MKKVLLSIISIFFCLGALVGGGLLLTGCDSPSSSQTQPLEPGGGFDESQNENGAENDENIVIDPEAVEAGYRVSVYCDPNGGTGGGTVANSSQYVNEDIYGNWSLSVTLPGAATRPGYIFVSWSGYAAGSSYSVSGTKPSKFASDTLYAVWEEEPEPEPVYYTYTYYSNPPVGGVAEDSFTETYEEGDTASVPSCPWSFSGYNYYFSGWSGFSSNVTSNRTINANWYYIEPVSDYDVTYDGNGATGGSTSGHYDVEEDTYITLRECGFTRSGYVFVEWNTNSSGTGTGYDPGDRYRVDYNEVLYAIWREAFVNVDELYDDEAGKMSEENVNVLLKYITGQADVNVDNAEEVLESLASAPKSSEDFRANVVSATGANKHAGQEIKITFGGLDWWATYLSTDTDGNIILTLWLDESQQDAFAGRTPTEGAYYGFINNSLYSDWSADWYNSLSYNYSYPSNMYGTSYIRAVTLNNGGQYATSYSALSSAYAQNSNSVFARFTMEEVDNSLTQYITTPSKVSWQTYQSSAVTNPSLSYYYPNDSIEDPADKGLEGSWYYSYMNYENKDGYKDWANDYIWLPSMAETGYNTSNIGLWETSTEQRQNISSSTDQITPGVGSSNSNYGTYVRNFSWLRSGRNNYADNALYLYPSGGGEYNINIVNYSYAVRPALHLNLNEVLDSFEFAKVGELYDDEAGKMSEENVNVLLKYITGQADVNVDNAEEVLGSLASATKSSEDFRANAVSATGANKQAGQEIKITFGGLDWWAVYLSKANGTGDNILTLWLANSTDTSKWSNGWYEDNSSYANPSNMYGSSYIRCVTLNAGGTYSTSSSGTASATQTETNKFARFTMEEVENSLTQYLITPSKVNWQLYQSAIKEIGFDYLFPNDSIEDPRPTLGGDYRYYNANKYYDYHGKSLYTAWENDYIWLPSFAETGYSTSQDGMWETSTEQRQNVSSSGSYSWLRSGSASNGASLAISLSPSGSSYGSNDVSNSRAVRPALHLNLSKVITDVLGIFKLTLDDNGGSGGDGEIFATEDGYYADEELATKIESVTVPSFTAHKFLGYFTEGGQQVTDANGVLTMTSSQFAEATTLYAHWEARNPAYYDSDGGYWYVENGKLPQSKVSESLKSTLSGQWGSLSNGDVYYMGVEELANSEFTSDGGMQSKVYNGNEYVKFNGEYYLVEPIRWRLVYSSSQQEGYAIENTSVLATMVKIVFLGSYSSTKIGAGEGYSAKSVTMLLKNQVSDDYLVSESREVEIFGTPKDTTTVSGSVFVASSEELANFKVSKNNTTGSGVKPGKASFSDFVKDYLRATGQGDYYFTRDLGDQLNTIRCLNPVGDRSQAKAQQTLGVQFTIKVTEYACVST